MSNRDQRRPLRCGMVGVGGFGKYRRERLRETGLFELVAALTWENRAYGEADFFAIQRRRHGEREPYEPIEPAGASDVCGNFRNFHRAIVSGGEPNPSLADGARAVAVVFAAEQSATTGQAVQIVAP